MAQQVFDALIGYEPPRCRSCDARVRVGELSQDGTCAICYESERGERQPLFSSDRRRGQVASEEH